MSAQAKFAQALEHISALMDHVDGCSDEVVGAVQNSANHIYNLFSSVVDDVESGPPPWAEAILEELRAIRGVIGPATKECLSGAIAPPSVSEEPEVQRSYSAAVVSPEHQKKADITEPPMTLVSPRRRRNRTRKQPVAWPMSLSPMVPTSPATTTTIRSPVTNSPQASAFVNERQIRTPRPRPFLRGSGAPNPNLTVAPRIKTVHVFYLTRNTTAEQVRSYVKQCRPNANLQVDQLVARGDYASFKIRVPESDFHDLMNPKFWPTGAAINEWRTRSIASPPKFA